MQINTPASVPPTEYSREFMQGMVDRMGNSFHKYGPVADAYPENVNAMKSLDKRLALYRQTGNREHLMDAANFLMIEFMHPAHQKAHLRTTSDAESPGRVWTDGEVSQRANDLTPYL